jgi:hypothetical protein
MTKLTADTPIRRMARPAKTQGRLPRGLTDRIVWHAVDDLKPFQGNPRRHRGLGRARPSGPLCPTGADGLHVDALEHYAWGESHCGFERTVF